MKFSIYFNYTIRDIESGEIVKAKHDILVVDANTRSSIDFDAIRARVRSIANAELDGEHQEVAHSNYYKIEKLN